MSDALKALANFVGLEIVFLLGSLLAIVLYKMLTGTINTANMLTDKDTGSISSTRVQLLVITLFAALYYLVLASKSTSRLPDMPQELLVALGGSNILYLGGKASSLLSQLFNQQPNQ